MDESTALVYWTQAKHAIEQAHSLDEVKGIRDKAAALQAYSRQIGESAEVQNKVAEIKIRAERRAGELIKAMPKAAGGRPTEKTDLSVRQVIEPSYRDLGIEHNQAHRWQRIAGIDDADFERHIQETVSRGRELTTAGVLSLAKSTERKEDIAKQIKDIEDGTAQLPPGLFEIIVADPPWPYGTEYNSEGRRAANPYPEMSLEEIGNIELPSADDCVLWLWTTHKFMRHSFELIDAWGFRDVAILTWIKDRMGLGVWLRSQSEFCIMAVKGKPTINLTNQTTVIRGEMREHSRKPDEFFQMVSDLCIGRKLDYFSREKRDGWEVFGNDTAKY